MKGSRNALAIALWLAGGVALATYALAVVAMLATNDLRSDFICYYDAARKIVAGAPLYPDVGYRYPPTLALMVTPLTALSPRAAQLLWTLANQAFLLAALALSLRLLPRRPDLRVETPLLLALVFGFFPLYTQLKLGQLGNLLFLLFALAATAWRRGRRLRAAWPIALAGAFKLYPLGLALWFARQGAWRAAAAVGVAFAAIVLVPDALFGRAWTLHYVAALPELFSWGVSPVSPDNWSFAGAIGRLVALAGGGAAAATFAAVGLASLAALALALACTPTGAMRGDVLAISFTATALPLTWANPIAWSHNFVFMLLAAPALVQRLGARRARGRAAGDAVAAGVALASWVLLSQPYRLPRLLGHDPAGAGAGSLLARSTFVAGALLLWLVMLRELRRALADADSVDEAERGEAQAAPWPVGRLSLGPSRR